MKSFLGDAVWEKLITFTIVRNPWSRQLSFYHYAVNNGFFGDMTFRDFILQINQQFETGQSCFDWHGPYFGSVDYLVDAQGRMLVERG